MSKSSQHESLFFSLLSLSFKENQYRFPPFNINQTGLMDHEIIRPTNPKPIENFVRQLMQKKITFLSPLWS